MPFTLDIIPHVPSLDMYGSARTGTAYSLSGDIVLTLTSQSSPVATRPQTIYLSSLAMTFEGRVEILSTNCGYAPFRLLALNKDLVSGGKPIALTNRDAKHGVMRWSMTFDLAVPGWLPPSASLDDNGSGTSYTLHAKAKFAEDYETALAAMTNTSASASTSSTASGASFFLPSVPSLSGAFAGFGSLNPFTSFSKPKIRATDACHVSIKVNRFRSPKSLNPFSGPAPEFSARLIPPQIHHPTPSMFPVSLESVETRVNITKDDEKLKDSKIPLSILKAIEVVAGVPEYVGIGEDKIPFSLRVRSTNPDAINKGLVLEAFDVEVEQVERFRSIPCESYTHAFPVPPTSSQPPNQPFLVPHPLEGLYTMGLSSTAEPVQWTRTVPMLPTKRINFRPSPATGGLEVDSEWAKMDLAINVLRKSDIEEIVEGVTDDDVTGRNTRRNLINQDLDTPFCRVRHDLKVALKLSWIPEPHASTFAAKMKRCSSGDRMRKLRAAHRERRTETLIINLPIKYVQVSEGVEKLYRTLGFHHGAFPTETPSSASMDTSRSPSPVPSLTNSSSGTSAASTPASAVLPLPSRSGRSSSPNPPSLSSHSGSSAASSCGSDIGNPMPYADVIASSSSFFTGPFVLPPYSELYHSNGDRKEISEGTWLPPYVPKIQHSGGEGLELVV